jgi:hypothetical protein
VVDGSVFREFVDCPKCVVPALVSSELVLPSTRENKWN